MDALKPCFCGNIPSLINDAFVDGGVLHDRWYVECLKCGAISLYKSENESDVIKRWNLEISKAKNKNTTKAWVQEG